MMMRTMIFLMLAVILVPTLEVEAGEQETEVGMAAISNMADGRTVYRSVMSHHRTERATTKNEPGRTDTTKNSVTFEEKVNLVRWHNAYRSNIEPAATNMEQMTWHDDLEAMAQAWTNLCVWEHGHPDGYEKPYSWVGQNMWAITGTYHETWAVNTWYNEIKNKNMAKLKLGEGCKGVCGHFTQVMWAQSDRVGCGITFCPTLDGVGKNAYFVVCNYGPGGNVGGSYIFDKGTSCSACPTSKPSCKNKLCTPAAACGGKTCSGSDSLIEDVCECGDPNTGATIPEGFGGGGSAGDHVVASPYVFLLLAAMATLR